MTAGSYVCYNAHPYLLDVEDCVKRAITLTTGMKYTLVSRRLNDHKRVTGVAEFNKQPNPDSYVENILGFPKVSVRNGADGGLATFGEFAREHPTGRYILSSDVHWTACIDGVIYDTWDCRGEMLAEHFEITRFERHKVEKKNCYRINREGRKYAYITSYDYSGKESNGRIKREDIPKHLSFYLDLDTVGEYI